MHGAAADQALRILRCIVRGFVLHEVMDSFFDPASYDESYESAIRVFITGLSSLTPSRPSVESDLVHRSLRGIGSA